MQPQAGLTQNRIAPPEVVTKNSEGKRGEDK
ncbi:hypothetical protein QG37_01524 [Candidozyma auris]|uniref:Uncharacterized protein n=1 Tax=Candidozyma auris TaxID=498019 RepID=A0A0L0P504_CANAR|nr:hypothetical protein QG37_01524 [[Candida] auris]